MSAGTLALTNKSDAVTGAGTAFNTELSAGDFIVVTVGGVPYTLPVKSVESATALTLVSVFTGPTQSGSAWSAVPRIALNMVTAALVAQSAEALRGLNYDKQNWQQFYSANGDITVTLPDGTSFTGPSLPKILELINAYKVTNGWDSAGSVKTFDSSSYDLNDIDYPGVVSAYYRCKHTPRSTGGLNVYNAAITDTTDMWWLVETTVHKDNNYRIQKATAFTGPDSPPYGLYVGREFIRTRGIDANQAGIWSPWRENQRTEFGAQFPSLEMAGGANYIDFHNNEIDSFYPDYSIRAVCNYQTGRALMAFMGGSIPAVIDAYGGYRCRPGLGAGGTDNTFNFMWEKPGILASYIDGTRTGQIQMVTSDERMKDIDSRERSGAEALGRIKAVSETALLTYKWKLGGVFSDEQPARLGFSAQRLQEVSQFYASGTGEGDDPNENQMNVEMLALISDQCAAIRELSNIVDELRKQVASLTPSVKTRSSN